jgi:hypothetical protein
MSLLQKLLALINAVDPAQLKQLFDFIKQLVDVFSAQGFQPKGFASGPEQDQVVQACVAKGCSEEEARELVGKLNA